VIPAEDLVLDTTDTLFLFLGLVPPEVGLAVVATIECFIGICFLIGTGALMRVAIWVLAAQFVGILSPLVLEPSRLFAAAGGREPPQKRSPRVRLEARTSEPDDES